MWQIAAASASAASAPIGPRNPSSALTIFCTCSLFAWAYPATAILICVAEYSASSIGFSATVKSATPRAWPSLSALCTLRAKKTFSRLTTPGRWRSMTCCKPRRIWLRRAPSASAGGGLMVPCAIWRSSLPTLSTTPQPVWIDPGSMPRMISRGPRPKPPFARGATGSARLVHQLGRNVEIGGHALHVVVVFQLFGEFQNLLHVLGVDIDAVLRHQRDLRARHGNFLLIEPVLDRGEIFRRRHHLENVLLVAHVLGAGVEHDAHQPLLVHLRLLHRDQPLFIEHPGHAAGLAQVAAVFGEQPANLGNGAIFIVGQDLRDDRRA